MDQTVHPEIVNIISQKTGVNPMDTARVINYYLKVVADSARRLTIAPSTGQSAEKERKYPRQLEAIRRPTATLSFEAFYAEPGDDADSFLETPAYDRIKITLVDVSDKGNKTCPKGNIQADDWHGIRMRSMRAFYSAGLQSAPPTPAPIAEATAPAISSAYTLRFGGGQFTGYTPAAVLVKWPQALNALEQMLAGMQQSVATMPQNAPYITATNEAISLFKAGKLDREATIAGMTDNPAPALPADTSAAYTRKFNMGDLKGKSPAAVLLEDPNNVGKLQSQKEFLAKNAEKFPANRQLMEAIDMALALHAAGKLSREAAEQTATTAADTSDDGGVVIYDSAWRAPRSYEKDKDGLSAVYRILITHDAVSKPKYPWKFSISNGRSLCKTGQNGRLIIGEIRKDETFITRYLNLSDDEWMTVLRKIELSYNRFYGDMFSERYDMACQYTDAKRKEYAASR